MASTWLKTYFYNQGMNSAPGAVLPWMPLEGMGPLHVADGVHDDMVSESMSVRAARELPLHPSVFKECVDRLDLTKAASVAQFDKVMSAVSVDRGIVPKVVYPKRCGGRCKSDDGESVIVILRSNFLRMMTRFVAAKCREYKCKPPLLSLKQFMFVIEIHDAKARHLEHVVQLTLANAQAGPHPAFQGFLRFNLPDEVDRSVRVEADVSRTIGVIVVPSCAEFINCKHKSATTFLDPVNTGSLGVVTVDELADSVVGQIRGYQHDELVEVSIVVSLVKHDSVLGTWIDSFGCTTQTELAICSI